MYFKLAHDGAVHALRASDGRILWQFCIWESGMPLDGMLSAADGVTSILAYDGTAYHSENERWVSHLPLHSGWPMNPTVTIGRLASSEGMIYIDGGSRVRCRRGSVSDGSVARQYHSKWTGLMASDHGENGIVYVSAAWGMR